MIMKRAFLALGLVVTLLTVASAQFAIFQTTSTQLTLNYTIGPGQQFDTPCNGDVQRQTANVTTQAGKPTLTVSTALFSAGDVGKTFSGIGFNDGGSNFQSTIASFVSSTEITVTLNFGTTLTAQSRAFVWGTNDAAAFNSFRTDAVANQGDLQVVLTIPSGAHCQLALDSGTLFVFQGIKNFILSGYEATIDNIGGGPVRFGSQGQRQNNSNSVPFETVTAGASCVTLKTVQPAVSISAATNSMASPATFTGEMASNVLTVTAVSVGTLEVGANIYSSDGGSFGTRIKALGTGTGGTGTYILDYPQTVTSRTMFSTGNILLTVSSTATLVDGETYYVSGTTGTQSFRNAAEGLKWIKVIDGTTIELFQQDFTTGYTSGGTIGGDRTTLFNVGDYALATGWVLQAYWGGGYGFPSNQQYFEWRKVASKNSTTQELCFDTPLTHAYKSTWPRYNTGTAFEIDTGGPATVYALNQFWNATHEYRGFTYIDPNSQNVAIGRSIKIKDVVMTGSHCIAPSQNLEFTWEGVTGASCNIEVDKLITVLNIINTTLSIIKFQSSSIDLVNLTNSIILNQMNGTPRRMVADNVQFLCGEDSPACPGGLQPGATSYGVSDSVHCTNCEILGALGLMEGFLGTLADNTAGDWWSMSGGVITIPNGLSVGVGDRDTQTRYMLPGRWMLWAGALAAIGPPFQITDVTQDTDNIYVHTTLAGGFPSAGHYTAGGRLSLVSFSVPEFSCNGCTGNYRVPMVANCGTHVLWTCMEATYTGGAAGTTSGNQFYVFGTLSSLEMTNTTPYLGAGALTGNLSRFNNWSVFDPATSTLKSFGTSPNGTAAINIKLPTDCAVIADCKRTLTPAGASNTQVGDTLTPPPTDAWFGNNNSGPNFSANTPSDSPQMTIKIITDPGFPYLLKRDLDPASNDNAPMFLNQAA